MMLCFTFLDSPWVLYIFHISVFQCLIANDAKTMSNFFNYMLYVQFYVFTWSSILVMILFLPFLYHCGGQIIYFILYFGSLICISSAHTSAGDSNVASAVINESVIEGEEARKFLEDVHVTSPQVF